MKYYVRKVESVKRASVTTLDHCKRIINVKCVEWDILEM